MIKSKSGLIAMAVLVAAVILCFKGAYYAYLQKKYVSLAQRTGELESRAVKGLVFSLADMPDGIDNPGVSTKYFLRDNFAREWKFKIDHSRLTTKLSERLGDFFSFCGFVTPDMAEAQLAINGEIYAGTVQRMVHIGHNADIDNPQAVGNLTHEQLQELLLHEIAAYLFNNYGIGYVISAEGILYAVDFDDFSFLQELQGVSYPEFKETLAVPFRIVDLKEQLKRIKSNLKPRPQGSVMVSGNWRQLYENKRQNIFYLVHEYMVAKGIPADTRRLFRMVNFILSLSRDEFMSLFGVPQLEGNGLYENYYNGLFARRAAMKEYFGNLYAMIRAECPQQEVAGLDEKMGLEDLKGLILLAERRSSVLEEELRNTGRGMLKQGVLHVVSCPEGRWVMLLAAKKFISLSQAQEILIKIKERSLDVDEQKAIDIYLEKVRSGLTPQGIEESR